MNEFDFEVNQKIEAIIPLPDFKGTIWACSKEQGNARFSDRC
jgi:hypothetical protein